MKLQIQSIHFDADQKLLDYIQKKCDKMDTFFDHIIDGQVYLKLEKHSESGANKVVELKFNVPGEVIMSTQKGHKFEEATDLAVDNVKRQLTRFKEKLRDH